MRRGSDGWLRKAMASKSLTQAVRVSSLKLAALRQPGFATKDHRHVAVLVAGGPLNRHAVRERRAHASAVACVAIVTGQQGMTSATFVSGRRPSSLGIGVGPLATNLSTLEQFVHAALFVGFFAFCTQSLALTE